MSKFVIQCPHCGTYNQVSDSFFAKNIVECTCGKIINVKRDKMKTVICPHCKNTVIYDQSEGTKAICPICKSKLMTEDSIKTIIDIKCPTCACELTVDKNASFYECALCNTKINVQEQIKKKEALKDGLFSVIKYEGSNDVLVWKHPIEDFNLGSQLIVHESQEAIFFKDGKALDLFGSGRYTLETENIPLFKEIYKLPTDSTAFHSEVYYINLTTQMGIKWGTDSKVRMFDPVSGLHIEIGACGQFNIRVINSRKLLVKLVGTSSGMSQNEILGTDYSTKTLNGKFKALVMSKVKSFLAKTIRENNINILEVDEYIDDISNLLKTKINETLFDYGLEMPEFFVTSIMTPDDDPNFKRLKEQHAERYLKVQQERILQAEAEAAQKRKIVQAQTGAQEQIIQAQAEAEAYRLKAEAEAREMQMKGYTYQQETQRKVAEAAVSNQGTGMIGDTSGLLNSMVGMGVGLGVMGEVVKQVKDSVNPVMGQSLEVGKDVASVVDPNKWECPNCHTISSSQYCPECGTKKTKDIKGWTCPNCGKANNTSMFCPECGTKKPEKNTWECSCGEKDIKTPFCPSCGKKKGE